MTKLDKSSLESPPFHGSTRNRTKKDIFSLIWSFIASLFHVVSLPTSKFDDNTWFSKCNRKGMKHSHCRKVLLLPTVPLEFVKELKRAANVTVNDVLMTAVSQAIADYCRSSTAETAGEEEARRSRSSQCRALLPVAFPRSSEEWEEKPLSNKWVLVSCDLAVGLVGDIDNIMDRLMQIHANTKKLKSTPRALIALGIQNHLVPMLPRSAARQTVYDIFSRHSLVLTNVPGPSEDVLFAGKQVDGVQILFSNLLTQVDFVSFSGKVYGNIVYDPEALPHMEGFAQSYIRALVQLAEKLQVEVPTNVLS